MTIRLSSCFLQFQFHCYTYKYFSICLVFKQYDQELARSTLNKLQHMSFCISVCFFVLHFYQATWIGSKYQINQRFCISLIVHFGNPSHTKNIQFCDKYTEYKSFLIIINYKFVIFNDLIFQLMFLIVFTNWTFVWKSFKLWAIISRHG